MIRYKGEILILFSTLSWGASYLFTKTALHSMSEFNLVALRFSIACVFTALLLPHIAFNIGKPEIVFGCRLGALLFTSTSLLAVGIESTAVSNAGFIIGSMVLLVAVMDAVASRKKPTPGLIAGVLLALLGMGVLTLRGTLAINPGDLYCLGAMIALAFHVMAAQQAGRQAHPVGVCIVQFATTGILAWAAGAFWSAPPLFIPRGSTLAAVLALGVTGTALAFVCQVVGQKYVSATRTAFLLTLEPVFATLFAWLFLHEPVTWHVCLGGSLLLAGVYASRT